tara:strand:- start:1646 stop:1933 length:288 start_codon:yes stop_codon:yes gene_type:complete
MAFVEELDVFFSDFADEVIYDNDTYIGQLDQPDEVIVDGRILTTEYELLVKTSDFSTVVFDKTIQVNGEEYSVRTMMKIDDGKFSKIMLSKDEEE